MLGRTYLAISLIVIEAVQVVLSGLEGGAYVFNLQTLHHLDSFGVTEEAEGWSKRTVSLCV